MSVAKELHLRVFELQMMRQEFLDTQQQMDKHAEASERMAEIVEDMKRIDERICSLLLQCPFDQFICGNEMIALHYREDGTVMARFEPIPEHDRQVLLLQCGDASSAMP